MNPPTRYQGGWTEAELREIEADHPRGMTVQQIVDAFTGKGERLTEATFRKYVQLGLLPRSVRVGRKGKHRGSQGLYPATSIRQIESIRRLMGQGFTIQEIQQEFLFVRGDIDALERQLERVFGAIDEALRQRDRDDIVERTLAEARKQAGELVSKLVAVETRLSMQARMARAAL